MRTKGPAHTENRDRILEIARRHVIEHGHAKLSLRAIAGDAGLAPASLYEYFAGKQEILDALAARSAASLRAAMEKRRDLARGARAQLVAIGEGYVAWARRHREDFLLLFAHTPTSRKKLTDDPPPASPYRVVIDAVAACGLPREDDVAYAFWAAAHGAAMLQLTHLARFPTDFEAADRALFTALIEGFSS